MTASLEHKETSSDARHGRDLTTGNIPRLLLSFSFPLLIGNAVQAGYSIVNRVWVGQFLGPAALAAITNTMQVAFILIALASGLTLGSSILVAQYAGARNWDGVRRVVQNALPLMIILGIALTIAGELLTVPLLRMIQVPPESFPLAVSYMRLFLLSFPLTFAAFLTTFLMRGVGDSLTPLIFQSFGVLITALLDPFLMFGWLGFPRLGLDGTAIAMLISQSVGVVAFFVYLHRKQHIIAPDWRRLRMEWPTNKIMLKISLPSAAQQLLVSFASLFVMVFINRFGDNTTAGFGAASLIDMVAFMFLAMSFSMSVSMLAGQNIGAGRYDRVRGIFWWGLLISGGSIFCVSLVATLFPTTLMRMFLNPQTDAEAFRVGTQYLRIVAPSYVCFAVTFVGIGVINGAGHTLVTTVIILLGLWGVRLPLAAYLSHRLGRVDGVWFALVVSFAVTAVLSLTYYASGLWKRAVIRPAPAAGDA